MGQLTQENRLISISDFSLGKDTFLATNLEGHERVSGLFSYKVDVLSENLDISPAAVIGKPGGVVVHDEHQREFNGVVTHFRVGEVKLNNLRHYQITLQPWLWFLSQTNNHRIFQDQTTKDIVTTVFSDLGFADFDFRAQGGESRPYCVQHNESDLHFVLRLLEEEGIAFYFEHSGGKHKLVLVDQANAYLALPETDLEYSNGSSANAQLNRWEHAYEFKKGQWTLNDYTLEDPDKGLIANEKSKSDYVKNAQFEHYEYPAYYDPALKQDLVRIRMEAEELGRDMVSASSNCSSFVAGGKFKVAKHESAAEKGAYIIVGIRYDIQDRTYYTGEEGQQSYQNHFYCVPASVHIRPKQEHKRPTMRGPQSALVVGPSGEEIYIDELGRIKVQFYWDREGKQDENSSCFLRVVQSWAGNQWGASFIPRIGHEVIVDFLDGDPDRPIVIGSVYNGKNKPPYASKTQSGIKTRSTKDATSDNYNELRFEDKKGAEQILIHAEKDYDVEVENNQTLTVDNDRTKTVKNNENSTIGNDRNKTVQNNQTENIANNKTIDVGADHQETIGKNMILDVGNNSSVSIGQNLTESVEKNMTLSVGGDLRETIEGKHIEAVTNEYGLSAKTITLEADDQVTLRTGSASIVLKSNGDITISGKNINVKGSGNIVLKGSKVTTN